MPVEPSAIGVGRCYVTHTGEVRKVLLIEGQKQLTYIARGKLAFPIWDAEARRITTREAFALEVEREVACEGQAQN